MMFPREGLP
jgi:hypothetical protein